jgi:cytochrome c1
MKPQEYDDNMADLVAYMTWMSEPGTTRKKAYWRYCVIIFGCLYRYRLALK